MWKFRKISIQDKLVTEVEGFIKKHGRYRSIAEFFSEAARLRLETLNKELNKNHSEE